MVIRKARRNLFLDQKTSPSCIVVHNRQKAEEGVGGVKWIQIAWAWRNKESKKNESENAEMLFLIAKWFPAVVQCCWSADNTNLQIYYRQVMKWWILPQKGIPCGVHVPLCPQILRDGPSNSKPRSQEYLATEPGRIVSVLKLTVEWAGAPGKPQFAETEKEKRRPILKYLYVSLYVVRKLSLRFVYTHLHRVGS